MSTRFTEILSAEPAALTHPHLSVSLDDTLAQQRAYDMMHSTSYKQPRSASGSSTATTTSSSSRNSTLPTNTSSLHLNTNTTSARTGSTSSLSSCGASADAEDGYVGSAPIEARTVKVWGSDSEQTGEQSNPGARSGPMTSVPGVVGVTGVAKKLRKKALGRRDS